MWERVGSKHGLQFGLTGSFRVGLIYDSPLGNDKDWTGALSSWVHEAAGPNKKIGVVMSQSGEESNTAPPSRSDRKSGRAVFDEGRTVWEWQTATGVFERHVSEEQLARLEAAGLRLVDQSHQDTGRVMYGAEAARQAFSTRKQVFLARPARVEQVGVLRQLWRRLVPSA